MSNGVKVLTPGEPVPSACPGILSFWNATSSRRAVDRLTRRLVVLGGITIIASILAILVVIAAEVYPLFKRPTALPVAVPAQTLPPSPLAMGVEEYREIGYLVTASGIQYAALVGGAPPPPLALPDLGQARIVSVSAPGRGPFALGLSDGRVIPLEMRFAVTHRESQRIIAPEPLLGDPLQVDPAGRPIRLVAYAAPKAGPVTVAAVGPKELVLVAVRERKALVGPSTRDAVR